MKKPGRKKIEETDPKVARRVREAILRGETQLAIMKAEGIGASPVTRIKQELEAERRAKAVMALEPLVQAAIRGGWSRRQVANALYEAFGVEIELREERGR